jgi:hypothetical protein
MNNITFVTGIFNIYETEYDKNKRVENRINHFESIAKQNIKIDLYTDDKYYDKILYLEKKYPKIKIINLNSIYNTEFSNIITNYEKETNLNLNLPSNRNIKKDTREYLLLINLKIELINNSIKMDEDKDENKYYYWFDFGLGYVFKNKEETINSMMKILNVKLIDEFIYIPGCWNGIYKNDNHLINNIIWRFCGGIIIGDKKSLLEFYNLCKNNYHRFFLKFNTLVWEVNYWAWIEKETNISIKWNYSNHDDSIVYVPENIIKLNNKLTKELIDSIDYENYYKNWISTKEDYLSQDFFDIPGKQHYRLLSYLSTLYNDSIIVDIGSHYGESALALSFNNSNKIYSFDIINKVSLPKKSISNINFILGDLFDDEVFLSEWKEIILNSKFIFLDVDPHNGHMEMKFYNFLKENNYNGFLVCDDIWYFKEMRDNFWYKINDELKYDLSNLGHWSGTGIINFNQNNICSVLFNKYNNNNWTLVTAYFNLAKCPDASEEVKTRDSDYYISHSISTLSLCMNMVIYCDEESLERIKKIRPKYLENKTKYIIRSFDEFKFVKDTTENLDLKIVKLLENNFSDYREIISSNRKKNPYYFDNRNVPSYYLFCMSRYIMLKETIKLNPFGSTHFAWINFCIERMGYKNLMKLDEGLSLNRDKFSTCYIDYISPELVGNLNEYFKWGRCSMCSGFFTGNLTYMYKVCDLIENKFLEYLDLGYGHADEQLYSPVYFENPDLFEHYYGDYQQMITNYAYIYEYVESPIRYIIGNSFANKNYKVCLDGCIFVLESIKLEKIQISEELFSKLIEYWIESKLNTLFYMDGKYMKINDEANVILEKIILKKLSKIENVICADYCKKIIDYIENNNLDILPSVYFGLYFSYWLSSYYTNRTNSKIILTNILKKINNSVSFREIYMENKDFYDAQFRFENCVIYCFLE